jgi:enterochelin esterase-like enzyme
MTTLRLVLAVVATAIACTVATFLACRYLGIGGGPPDAGGSAEGRSGEVHSAALGERREFSVYLPAGYEDDASARYPVLYVLEGESQAAHTAESASLLARLGVIPPILVVGVPSVDDGTRARDFTAPAEWTASEGGVRRFLSFLGEDLIPRVEGEYRTARPRMLAGWSRTGQFTLYSQVAAPELFDARFAHSPFVWSAEDEPVAASFEAGLGAASPDPSFLYLSLGDEETRTRAPFDHAVRALEERAPANLRWRADVVADADHGSNPVMSAPVALCAMFAPESGQVCRTRPRAG